MTERVSQWKNIDAPYLGGAEVKDLAGVSGLAASQVINFTYIERIIWMSKNKKGILGMC